MHNCLTGLPRRLILELAFEPEATRAVHELQHSWPRSLAFCLKISLGNG
jgi:hypothetical protein